MTQKDRVYQLIQEAKGKGISTNELRDITHFADVPKVVSDLNDAGAGIKSVENGDGTVTYFLEYQPIKQWVKTGPDSYGWVSVGVKRISIKPRKHAPIDMSNWIIKDQEGKVVNI